MTDAGDEERHSDDCRRRLLQARDVLPAREGGRHGLSASRDRPGARLARVCGAHELSLRVEEEQAQLVLFGDVANGLLQLALGQESADVLGGSA